MTRQIPISVPATNEDEWHAVKPVIESGWVTTGPRCQEFEDAFARYHHVDYALSVSSGTAALHLALAAIDVGPGDEVIVPSFTWVATANAVEYCGATPIFADVESQSFNLDIADVLKKVTPRTKAVIPVHLFGLCAKVDALKAQLPESIWIIEDAACAAGASTGQSMAGSLGDIACFSFHPRKIITTGEGGMLTTSNRQLHRKMAALRNHGIDPSISTASPHFMPDIDEVGFNYRLTDIQAAVGLVQLSKLDTFIKQRERWAAKYQDQLAGLEWLGLPSAPDHDRHSWQSFVTYVNPATAPKSRDEIMAFLKNEGISTRPGTYAVHMLGTFKSKYKLLDDDCPVSKSCHNQSMALPLHNKMTDDDIDFIVEKLKGIS